MFRTASTALCALCILSFGAEAQTSARFSAFPPPDVLSPSPKLWYIGPQVGLNLNSHPGDFLPDCEQCNFSDGAGAGIMVGVQLERRLSPSLGLAVKLLYDDKRADYTETLLKQSRVVSDQTTAVVDLERTMNVELAYVVLNPVVEIFPVKNLYLLAGPGLGLPLQSRYHIVERLLDDQYVYYQTGKGEIVIGKEDWNEIPDISSLRIDFRVGVGYDLRLGYSTFLTPEIIYEYPLTTISADDNWKASAIRFAAVLKFAL